MNVIHNILIHKCIKDGDIEASFIVLEIYMGHYCADVTQGIAVVSCYKKKTMNVFLPLNEPSLSCIFKKTMSVNF